MFCMLSLSASTTFCAVQVRLSSVVGDAGVTLGASCVGRAFEMFTSTLRFSEARELSFAKTVTLTSWYREKLPPPRVAFKTLPFTTEKKVWLYTRTPSTSQRKYTVMLLCASVAVVFAVMLSMVVGAGGANTGVVTFGKLPEQLAAHSPPGVESSHVTFVKVLLSESLMSCSASPFEQKREDRKSVV